MGHVAQGQFSAELAPFGGRVRKRLADSCVCGALEVEVFDGLYGGCFAGAELVGRVAVFAVVLASAHFCPVASLVR
jgi:hypothetical protein